MKTINVLQFICPSGFYGAEMWILALAKNLDPERVNCMLAVTRESDGQNLEISKRFGAIGLNAREISMKGRFDPMVILKLARYVKENDIHIIHTHGYKSDILGLLVSRVAGIKIVATPHGFENAPNRKLQLYISVGNRALKHVDRVAPLSDELLSDILRLGVRPQKARLIVNGVDLDEVETEREKETVAPWSSKERKIGYVGQIAFRKNIGDLIRAFGLLCQDLPDVRLVLVGDGSSRQELEEMAKTMGLASRIDFMGYRTDRLSLMKHFDVFAMTSSLEGIPRCMMEAMGLGVPVAAFSIPGVDRLVIHERTGLLSEFGDVHGLKECLRRMLADQELSHRLALNGRQHVLDNFSAKRMADEYAELYKEMVGEAVTSQKTCGN